MELLPHNKSAYDTVVQHLTQNNRTCVIHPTGTGKSYIALQLIEDNPDARILYITSLAINLLEFWDKVDGLGRRMILNLSNINRLVGTGKKGDLDGANDEDAEAEYIDDEDRKEMLKKATRIDDTHMSGPLVQFCLYAGLDNLLPDFDFILIDEFHRAGAPRWEAKVNLLLGENKEAKVVGFSATPERMDGRDMRSLFNYDVASEMLLSEAIAKGLLPLPKYWLGKVEIDKKEEEEGDNDAENDDAENNGVEQFEKKLKKRGYPSVAIRHLEAGEGLRDVFRSAFIPEHAEHGKFIVFCRTISNTKRMIQASEDWFDWVDEVHRYEMHTKNRYGYSDFVNDDSDSLRLLFVVDMLTEGIHIKDLDGIIMIRPTDSQRVYYQQLGRAMAVTTVREHPLILDIVSNAGVMKAGLNFLKELGHQLGMSEDELQKFFHVTAEAADFVSYVEETEYDYYGAMKAFYEENGHLYIPPGYKADGHDVYREFNTIRSRRALLAEDYRKKYEKIGMDWEITYQWMQGYWSAVAFHSDFGNLNVPSSLGNYHGIWLYDWVKKNKENKEKLCERQIAMLDSLGMDWTIIDPWEERFKELVRFKAENGHVDVSGDYGRLGKWVMELRKRPPEGERRTRLDEIGFEWDGRASHSRNAWRAGVRHSREYYFRHGDLKVPNGYISEDGYKLGTFVKNTKRNGRIAELEEEVVQPAKN